MRMLLTVAALFATSAAAQEDEALKQDTCKQIDTSGFTTKFERGGVYIKSAIHVIDLVVTEDLGVCFRLSGDDEFTHQKPKNKPEGGSWDGEIVFEPNMITQQLADGSSANWLIHEGGAKKSLLPFYDGYALFNFNRYYSVGLEPIYDGYAMLNFNRHKSTGEASEAADASVTPTGDRESPSDGEDRRLWQVDVAQLYYDGQIDSEIFLIRMDVELSEQ